MLKSILIFSLAVVFLLSGCRDSDKDLSSGVKLSAQPRIVEYNGSITMTWSSSNVDYCIASGDWAGNIKKSGSKTLGPLTEDSLFILDCYNSGVEVSDSISVTVKVPAIPVVTLSASPLSIGYADSTTISWSGAHVKRCTASGDWSGDRDTSGSHLIEDLKSDSVFILQCSGARGDVTGSARVEVAEPGVEVPLVSLSASPSSLSYNGSTTLSWSSPAADSCRASGDWFGSKSIAGSQTMANLTADSRFILKCSIAGEGDGVDAAEVRVAKANVPVVSLTASPLSVKYNGSITLNWSSTHADSCIASGDWYGTKSASGSQTIRGLTTDRHYRLSCGGTGGKGRDSIRITVNPNPLN